MHLLGHHRCAHDSPSANEREWSLILVRVVLIVFYKIDFTHRLTFFYDWILPANKKIPRTSVDWSRQIGIHSQVQVRVQTTRGCKRSLFTCGV